MPMFNQGPDGLNVLPLGEDIMVTQLKNVIIVDGTGWEPYWGDVLIEDGKIKDIISGENIVIAEEKNFDKILNFKVGEFPNAWLVPAFEDGMTKEKFQKELDEIKSDMASGMKIQKSIRKMTGFGVGQREYLVKGMVANVMVIDKKTKEMLAAFADGKEL